MDMCIFCKIARGEVACEKIWEDENYLAFLDAGPVSYGHTLLIPKKHTDYIFDLEDTQYTDLLLKAKNIAKLLQIKLNPKRVGMAVEGFGVAHVHIHLIPINEAGGMDSKHRKNAKKEELKKLRDKILNK